MLQSIQLGCEIDFWGIDLSIYFLVIQETPDRDHSFASVVETPSHQLTQSQSAVLLSTMLASYVWWVLMSFAYKCLDQLMVESRCARRAWRERWSLLTLRTSLTAPRWPWIITINTVDNMLCWQSSKRLHISILDTPACFRFWFSICQTWPK